MYIAYIYPYAYISLNIPIYPYIFLYIPIYPYTTVNIISLHELPSIQTIPDGLMGTIHIQTLAVLIVVIQGWQVAQSCFAWTSCERLETWQPLKVRHFGRLFLRNVRSRNIPMSKQFL